MLNAGAAKLYSSEELPRHVSSSCFRIVGFEEVYANEISVDSQTAYRRRASDRCEGEQRG
jgi:hypothetical protein